MSIIADRLCRRRAGRQWAGAPAAPITGLVSALRYAWRQLHRTPGFTITAVATLALGIATTTAFFSIVNAMILKPLPGLNLDHVVAIGKGVPSPTSSFSTGSRRFRVTLPEVRALEADPVSGIAAVAATATWPTLLRRPGRAEGVQAELVTGHYARVLALHAMHGRWIGPEDDREPRGETVAVISHRLWREWFDGRADVVGRATMRLRMEGPPLTQTFTVVGVAPPAFHGSRGRFERRDVWIPVATVQGFLAADQTSWLRFLHLTTVARLDGDQSHESLAARLQPRLAMSADQPAGRAPARVRVSPAARVLDASSLVSLSTVVLLLASLVLVAACANLANMLYARGAGRAAELAVRLSLGAHRGHLVRLLFAEIAIVAALAAAIGLALALAVTRLFSEAFPYLIAGRYPGFTLDLSPDVRVFAFAYAAGAAAAIVVGGATAWRTVRAPLLQTLAGSGAPAGMTARGHRRRTTLVAVQVVVAVVLVMFSGLAFEEFRTALDRSGAWGRRVHYDLSALATTKINLALHDYDAARARDFLTRAAGAVRKIGGVEAVAVADSLPGADDSTGTLFAAGDRDGQPSTVRRVNGTYARVSRDYLATIGLPLLRGRDFTPIDVEGAEPVAIVSERTAEWLWPGQDPIGQPMMFGAPNAWVTVVGVAADPISAAGSAPLRRAHFALVPFAQHKTTAMRIVVRTRAPDGHLGAVREALRALDEEVAVLEAGWAENAAAMTWINPQQAAMLLVMSLGALALGISMLGVYGVMAYFVSTRTREFGIRLALGATRRGVVKLVLDQAVHITLIGLLAGVFIVSVASRVIQSRRFDFMPNEIETWVAVPLLILAAGVAAGVIPAARAARVNPNAALKDL
jgi:predicted permease